MNLFIALQDARYITTLRGANSTLGKQCVLELRDQLSVFQEYLRFNGENKIFVRKLNLPEIMDIAYSYHMFQKTGDLVKLVYAEPDSSITRFGEPNLNKEYTYSKMSPFAINTVGPYMYSDVSDRKTLDFAVEPEFNVWAKEWLNNSPTLFSITSIKALGYDDNGEFGLFTEIPVSELPKHLPEVLEAFLKFGAEKDMSTENSTKVDTRIEICNDILNSGRSSGIVYNRVYNQINYLRTPERDPLLNLYQRVMKPLISEPTDLRRKEMYQRILGDSGYIFKAKRSNLEDSLDLKQSNFKSIFESLTTEEERDSIGMRKTNVSDSSRIDVILTGMGDLVRRGNLAQVTKDLPKSLVLDTKLWYIVDSLSYDDGADFNLPNVQLGTEILNNTLSRYGLKYQLTRDDYREITYYLYSKFGIVFTSHLDSKLFYQKLSDGLGLAQEETNTKAPTTALENFAHIITRSAHSYVRRRAIENSI